MNLSVIAIFYVVVCLASIAPIFWVNRALFRGEGRARPTRIEWVLLAVGIPALLIGWYHNLAYFSQYGEAAGWWHWTLQLFVNPASASAGQDLIFANLLLFPLWNAIEGRRYGMRLWWWYFPMSLLTSYAFGIAMFMAMQLRQAEFNKANAGWAGEHRTHSTAT